jgi:hypothetical protein
MGRCVHIFVVYSDYYERSDFVQTDVTLERALVAAQRSWIRAQIDIDGEFKFESNGQAWLSVQVYLKNYGNSVARSIEIEQKIFGPARNVEDLLHGAGRRQREVCNQAIAANSPDPFKSRLTLFPNEDYAHSFGVWMSKDEIEKAILRAPTNRYPGNMIVPLGVLTFKNYITPMLIGCITYRSSFSEQPHQTGFIYEIEHIDPANPTRSSVLAADTAIAIGMNVPKNELRLKRWFLSGNYAE